MIDTVVFVKDGKISKTYELELKVKVPSGMVEQDLARPVIDIRDFETNNLQYEIYTFGEENVIVPVSKKVTKFGIEKLAEDRIKEIITKFDPHAEIEIISDNKVKILVDKKRIPSIIGRGGSTINELEKILNVHIDVEERAHSDSVSGQNLSFDFSESKSSVLFKVGKEYVGKFVELYINGDYLTSGKIGRKGHLKIPKRSALARKLMKFTDSKKNIGIFLTA